MRIKKTCTTIYCFKELPDNVQEKAIENLYDINIDYDWWTFIYEDAEQIGIKITEFNIDRGQYCKIDCFEDWSIVADLIIKNHGEQCETYLTAKNFLKERGDLVSKYSNGIDTSTVTYENEYDFDNDCDDLGHEFQKDLSEDYRIILTKEYDYLTSKEAIKDTIEANEYEFNINGTIEV